MYMFEGSLIAALVVWYGLCRGSVSVMCGGPNEHNAAYNASQFFFFYDRQWIRL
jgi:hypothetical protein